MRTSAPRRASSSAIARPMPRPPPVIRASLPAKSLSLTDCHPEPAKDPHLRAYDETRILRSFLPQDDNVSLLQGGFDAQVHIAFERLRNGAAVLGCLGRLLERGLVGVRHAATNLERARDHLEAATDPVERYGGGYVERLGWRAGLSEPIRERHRVAARVRGSQQLLGAGLALRVRLRAARPADLELLEGATGCRAHVAFAGGKVAAPGHVGLAKCCHGGCSLRSGIAFAPDLTGCYADGPRGSGRSHDRATASADGFRRADRPPTGRGLPGAHRSRGSRRSALAQHYRNQSRRDGDRRRARSRTG